MDDLNRVLFNNLVKFWMLAMIEIFGEITDYSVTGMRVSSGGGMNVPSMSNGVIVTHLPTGITVKCDTETSQHDNREKCLAEIKNQLDARSI